MSHRKRMVGLASLILILVFMTALLANLPSYGTTTTGRTVITGGVIMQQEQPRVLEEVVIEEEPTITEEIIIEEPYTPIITTLTAEEQYILAHDLAYYTARKLQRPVITSAKVEELVTITSGLQAAGIKEGMTIETIATNKELRSVFRSALDYR